MHVEAPDKLYWPAAQRSCAVPVSNTTPVLQQFDPVTDLPEESTIARTPLFSTINPYANEAHAPLGAILPR
jgi:hypothetical protein